MLIKHFTNRFTLIAVIAIQMLWAEVLTFTDQGEYLQALNSMGYSTWVENFESPAWDHVRSNYPVENSAPSVTRHGVTWSGNEPISTNTNWGRFGTWGIFTVYTPPYMTPDELLGESVEVLYGIGGWFNSNPDYAADIGIELDGVLSADRNIGTGHQFLGVIDTNGFNTFHIVDLEVESVWGADDFRFGYLTNLTGDVNQDGSLDVLDVLEVVTMILNPDVPDLLSGDMNDDGQLTIQDVILLVGIILEG